MADRFNPWRQAPSLYVPNWLAERPEVSPGAKLTYGRLAQHAGRDGECKPRQEVLAVELAVSDRQVRRYLDELESAGLIEVEQLGLQRANRYHFLQHPWMESGPAWTDTSAPERDGMAGPERTDMSGPSKGSESKEGSHSKRVQQSDIHPSLPGRGLGNVRELKVVAMQQGQRRGIAERAYLRYLERFGRKPQYPGKLFEDAIFELLEADYPLTRLEEALDRCEGNPWRFKEEAAVLKGQADGSKIVPDRPEYQPMVRREDQDVPDTPENRARAAAILERVNRNTYARARKNQAAGRELGKADQSALAYGVERGWDREDA